MKLFLGCLLVVLVSANCPQANCKFGCQQTGTDCATTCDVTQPYFGYKVCKCKNGYTGPTCAQIKKGFFINGAVAQACSCNTVGSTGNCNSATGNCECNPGYTGASCTTCANDFVANPAAPGQCLGCSVLYPNCQTCQNGACTACKASSNSILPNCNTCQAGFVSLVAGGPCFIKCTDHCGASVSLTVPGTAFPGAPPTTQVANPTCSYATATGVTCTKCADSKADPASRCIECQAKTYKGRREFVTPPAVGQLSVLPKCWDCNCGTGAGVIAAGTCMWQQNTRLCDCKSGYTHSTQGDRLYGTCTACAVGYFAETVASGLQCTKCPAKCSSCSDATTCTACAFGFTSSKGSCDTCAPNFVKAGVDPAHTCTLNTAITTIKFTPKTAGPYVSSAGQATITGDVEVTSTVDTPVDYTKLKITSQADKGWVVPAIKQEVAGGKGQAKAKITVSFQCDSTFCHPQSLMFVYTDSTGYSATTKQAVVLQAATTGPAPKFVFCQSSKEMPFDRYSNMKESGKELTLETIASPSDAGLTLTTTVKKEVNGATAVEIPAADYTSSRFGALSYMTISPTLELGVNKFTVEVKDSQTPAQTGTCTFTIKLDDKVAPDLTCWDIPKMPSSAGVPYAKIAMPLPLCEDTGACTIKNAAGTTLTAGSVENVYIGTHSVKRTATDPSSNAAECEFKVIVEDKEKPQCSAGADVTVSVPALAGTTFRKEKDCPSVEFDIQFTSTDNSVATVPAGTTVSGTAPAASITAKPALGCKCDGDVGTFKCAKQKCVRNYNCLVPVPPPVEIQTTVCDDADNCQDSDCKVKVTFTDTEAPGKPKVQAACDYLKANPFPTDVDKATFSSSMLRVDKLQQDGFVFDTAGGKVTCAVDGLPADVPVGAEERTLKCTDLRKNTAECKFKLTVVDRQIPTFGDSAANGVCGKELGPFDNGSGPTEAWAGVKDNAELNANPLKFFVNGANKATFPTSWEPGYYYVKATLTDKVDNMAFCSFSFRVKGTKVPSAAYKKPDIKKEKKAKTAKPTKFPTNKPAPSTKIQTNSCKTRCTKDGQTKQIDGAMFTCSCQRDVCVTGNKKGVKCCKDMDKYCANTNKCNKKDCGASVGTGNNKCYCDLNCANKGDCCPGFNFLETCCADKDKKPSCKGKCGKADSQFSCSTGTSCYCDHTCQSVGDCCEDYLTQC